MADSTLLNIAQIRALGSPLRHRILGFLETEGPLTGRGLADRLGASPETIHYHLKQLRQVKLVREVGSEQTARRDARLFDLAFASAEVNLGDASAGYRKAYAEMSSALLRWADRCHAGAVTDTGVQQSGVAQQRSLMQFHVRLKPAALKQLNKKLKELEAFLDTETDESGSSYVVTCVVAPFGSEGD